MDSYTFDTLQVHIKTPHTPSDVARIVKVGHDKFENEVITSILGQDGVAIRLASWEPYLSKDDEALRHSINA